MELNLFNKKTQELVDFLFVSSGLLILLFYFILLIYFFLRLL